ncbi:hypothetical protein L596_026273 [Steinernema carpocapsae]|uniref:Uncharacterized protein n=1 Tax=Steinernema carpocapsae TaxID=34508 RepID=A0A4U5M0V5_STECR|nr:hypothetical protein L596_026273 [Steinernema carpocapsae]
MSEGRVKATSITAPVGLFSGSFESQDSPNKISVSFINYAVDSLDIIVPIYFFYCMPNYGDECPGVD